MHSKHTFISIVIEYRLISKKGEGTFSEVLKAQSIKTGKYVAIKCMKAHFYNIDQVKISHSDFIPTIYLMHLLSIGKQFERNLSFEKTITTSKYNYPS